jgi:hypothetical protein
MSDEPSSQWQHKPAHSLFVSTIITVDDLQARMEKFVIRLCTPDDPRHKSHPRCERNEPKQRTRIQKPDRDRIDSSIGYADWACVSPPPGRDTASPSLTYDEAVLLSSPASRSLSSSIRATASLMSQAPVHVGLAAAEPDLEQLHHLALAVPRAAHVAVEHLAGPLLPYPRMHPPGQVRPSASLPEVVGRELAGEHL